MEVKRNLEPKKNFLRNVRNLANKHNIVLIFDECTSGFRSCIGGLHLKYKIEPDICLFGKALGNGYPINAVIGKRDIMKEANKTFISSTFWSERLGPSAALKTIEIMKRDKTYNYIESFTKKIKKLWNATAKKNKIKIDIEGMDFDVMKSINLTFYNPRVICIEILNKKNNTYKKCITVQYV